MRYYEIIEYIEELIKEEQLISGSKLPSVRILAEELKCSKSTVVKAYEQLVSHKLAYVIDKSGYYLMQNPQDILLSDQVNFTSMHLNPSLIQQNDIQILFNKMMINYNVEEDDIQGSFDLRDSLKAWFKKRKIFSNVHDILIHSSKKEALNVILQIFKEGNGKILVENPMDDHAKEVFSDLDNVIFFNRVDTQLDTSLIEYHLIKENVQLIYISSQGYGPKGQDLSLKDKMDLLSLCYNHDVYVIENNMIEETYGYEQEQSLYALDKQDHVFHLKSFEYSYHQMFKIVAVVSPRLYVNTMIKSKMKFYGETSQLEQLILNEIYRSDALEEAEKKLVFQLKQKLDLIEEHLILKDGFYLTRFSNQMGCYVEVPSDFNIKMMAIELRKHNMIIDNANQEFIGYQLYKGFNIFVTKCSSSDVIHLAKWISDYIENN
ncbi:MAG: GntR family transcriptional regulator [Clostridia bacterium]|nr:GntR family transcriptional regulator [Clostridia bacterium]